MAALAKIPGLNKVFKKKKSDDESDDEFDDDFDDVAAPQPDPEAVGDEVSPSEESEEGGESAPGGQDDDIDFDDVDFDDDDLEEEEDAKERR